MKSLKKSITAMFRRLTPKLKRLSDRITGRDMGCSLSGSTMSSNPSSPTVTKVKAATTLCQFVVNRRVSIALRPNFFQILQPNARDAADNGTRQGSKRAQREPTCQAQATV
eukprot:gnl/TRDRNA2_/TRDRNA2_109578_c0_seq1.p2 gnl/TRDRNA2_/TRDRNA2_109578_c0~~gnl/TRDRNA2_/TRDRNA2_109578_c0_seq1.p2  ORF type:complete len:111 (-),score=15.24 gnl/TRDRNA2_/TRDRNA2_109578_c0_seq1:233-565(-)